MKEHKIFPSDEILLHNGNDLIIKEDNIYIKLARQEQNIDVEILDLSPRDIFLVLYKTGFNYFSRYFKGDQLITSFQDLMDILMLKSQIEGLDNRKISAKMRFLDPSKLFHYAYGVTLYKNNYEGINISLDEVIKNFANCKEKRLVENRPLINPLQPKKEEEND